MFPTMRMGFFSRVICCSCLVWPAAVLAQTDSSTGMPAYHYPPPFYGGYAPYGYPPVQAPASRSAPISTPNRANASVPASAEEQSAPAGASSDVGQERQPPNRASLPDALGIEESRLGWVLTSDRALTLYRSTHDAEGADRAEDDASLWRPFLMSHSEQPASPFGAVPHPDGSRQWSYDGHPLYLWFGDEQAGDVTGDGVDGIWQAVRVSAQDALAGSVLGSDRESRQ